MNHLIPILLTAVAIATALNVALKRINMPTVIGYIVTGAIVGALFDVDVHDNKTLEHVAEFGVVFLMFTIGLEFSVSHLNSMKREVFVFGLLQVIVTAVVLAVIAYLAFGIDFRTSILVGAGLALSSTAIVLKILNETGQIKTQFGRNALGILIFQDIAVIPILLMITIFSNNDKSLGELLLATAANAVLALAILILVGRFVLCRVFRAVSEANSKEIYMGSVLLTVMGASHVAHYFGFSYSLGAFIAGMMIADTLYKYQVEADLIPFRDLLLGVFFVSVGLRIDMGAVAENIVTVVALGAGVMVVKATLMFALLSVAGSRRLALKTGISLAQVGEFSLVVFSLLPANHMLDAASVQIMLVMIVASMVVTPVLISNADRISAPFFKVRLDEQAPDQTGIIGGHIILCGYGSFGRAVSDRLDHYAINHVVLTNNTEAYVKAKEAGKAVVFGDPADRVLLESLHIREAMGIILALDDIEEVKRAGAAITLIDPALRLIAKIPTEEARRELADFNHEFLLDGNSHNAALLVDRIRRSRLLAIETSRLQHLADYSLAVPVEAIGKVEREQARLLDCMSKSFNALREERDVLQIKAFHDSFTALSGIIGDVIDDIIKHADLSVSEYERINVLLDNQEQLMAMNQVLEELGQELITLERNEKTRTLAHMAVEGLDALLMSLQDMAASYSEEDFRLLRNMTSSEGRGLSRIRESYLGADVGLDPAAKALLLSATNHIDRLKALFGQLGNNYRKLAEAVI